MSDDKRTTPIILRPRLTIHRELTPDLYDALAAVPENLRTEFVALALRDWSLNRRHTPAAGGACEPDLQAPSSSEVAKTAQQSIDTTLSDAGSDSTVIDKMIGIFKPRPQRT